MEASKALELLDELDSGGALLERMGQHDRVLVIGGPRTGKTRLATESAYQHKRAHLHTDSLIGAFDPADKERDWSMQSDHIARKLSEDGRWVIEGVAGIRGLRKWLEANPGAPLPFAVVHMRDAKEDRTGGQEAMAKGIDTIWSGIESELSLRGAIIL